MTAVGPLKYDELIAVLEREDAARAEAMPTTAAALGTALSAKERLKTLGWHDGGSCPKDGSWFALIEWGSTGIHSGKYWGDWPTGRIYSGDFFVHPHAVMWKLIPDLTDDERIAIEKSDASTRDFINRMGEAAMGRNR